MPGLSKQQTLETLRARIETIEKRPPLAEAAPRRFDRSNNRFALPAGMLHEIFTDSHRHAGAVLGFALGAARDLLSAERPAILYLQMSADTSETGLPYAIGIASFGLDPEAIVLVRPATILELLWAAEEALSCRAVAAVIADIGSDPKALDFTASRRLGLRVAEHSSTFLLLRYGAARNASAARLRWHVEPQLSATQPFDLNAPGESRWRLRMEKGLWRGRPGGEWVLSWTENGFDIVDIPDAAGIAPAAPSHGDFPAALGDRLSQTA
jgi:protein ImuA